MNKNNNSSNKKDNNNNNNRGGISSVGFAIVLAIILVAILNVLTLTSIGGRYQVSYDQFSDLLNSGSIESVSIENEQLSFKLKEDTDTGQFEDILDDSDISDRNLARTVFYTGSINNPGLVDMLEENNVKYYSPIVRNNPILNFFLYWIVPITLIGMIFRFLMNRAARRMSENLKDMDQSGGGIFGGFGNPGKSGAKEYNVEKNVKVTFDDVAGQNEAKKSLKEIVDFLNNPKKYKKIGAKQPKGALLVGPPGTGKTLIARAVAGEAHVPFYYITGSEFVQMFVGVGASRVRDLFTQAKENSPAIIFIDEIDAIGKSRDSSYSNDEREQTLNQLLAEMDGFDSSDPVVVLAATNRPESLDKALLRPGRFDRTIIIDKPDLNGRIEILKVHLKGVRHEPNLDIEKIALMTSGASGADLANIINEAALRAVRMNREKINQEDLQESVERVIAGDEMQDRILSPKEKKLVSYHEVGHALVAALQKDSSPVQKITIVPRTIGALGYTLQAPEEERFLMTKNEILDQIRVLLGGRAAEDTMLGVQSTGATNDIEKATELARNMVTKYGMSDRFGMMGLESTQNRYLDGRSVLTSSEATGLEIDNEVHSIIDTCYEDARNILEENKEALEAISDYLYEKETITGEEFMDILDNYHRYKEEHK